MTSPPLMITDQSAARKETFAFVFFAKGGHWHQASEQISKAQVEKWIADDGMLDHTNPEFIAQCTVH